VRGRVFDLAAAGDTRLLPAGSDWPGILSDALDDGVASLAKRLGENMDSWRWGDLHRLAPAASGEGEGPFGFPLPGDPETVRMVSHLHGGADYRVQSGSVARYAFDLGDWDRSGWVIPHGVGGDASHPHFADQVQAWKGARLLPMPYSPNAVEQATQAETILLP
jgi:penicillin G amidase